MNSGLLLKTWREMCPIFVIVAPGMMVFEALLMHVLSSFQGEVSAQMLQVQFIQDMVKGLMGGEFGPESGPQALVALPWVHPVILALLCSYVIALCTRIPAGEVDRGTIDVLLGLPVSRLQVYLHESAMWLVSGIIIVALGLLGGVYGLRALEPQLRPEGGRLGIIAVNMYALYLAVGGLAYVVSALSERRGRAMAVIFGIVVLSLLLSFLAQTWEPARSIVFLSVLDYYRPARILDNGAWPVGDLAVLGGCAAVTWTAAAIIFMRRDIATT